MRSIVIDAENRMTMLYKLYILYRCCGANKSSAFNRHI